MFYLNIESLYSKIYCRQYNFWTTLISLPKIYVEPSEIRRGGNNISSRMRDEDVRYRTSIYFISITTPDLKVIDSC